jgi:hypothetical protein
MGSTYPISPVLVAILTALRIFMTARRHQWSTWLCGLAALVIAPALVIVSTPVLVSGVEASENAVLSAAANSITAQDLMAHVEVLAADAFEGREAGSRGGYAAAGYIVEKLEKQGVRPAGKDGGFYQLFGNGYRNILGVVPGTDQTLGSEVVIIGAHYDHVGYGTSKNSFGPTGYIHNGADDNASGVSALLEIAEAIYDGRLKPKRTILFCFWDGEEKGLLGSKHWTNQPTVPFERVVFAVNLDMIGRLRNGTCEVYGVRTAEGLRRLVSRANPDPKLQLDFSWELKDNSDHHTFVSRGIPTLMFHTGLHDTYHRPTDDANTLNAEGMETVSRLAFQSVWSASQSPSPWEFRNRCRAEFSQDQEKLHAPHLTLPPRLGVGWPKTEVTAADGIEISSVQGGSAAASAGLRIGDRMTALNGQPLASIDDFQLKIHAAASPIQLSIARQDSDGPFDVEVELAGMPSRIGFSWRPDDGDPNALVITRVTPGSAAAAGGVRLGDHIYLINDQPIQSSDWLLDRLINDPGPFSIQVDRNGVCLDLRLDPLPPLSK